jgi:hypothetical protein
MMDIFIEKKKLINKDYEKYALSMLKLMSDLIDVYVPSIDDYTYITENRVTESDIVNCINEILQVLDFHIIYDSSEDFVHYYLSPFKKKLTRDNRHHEDELYQKVMEKLYLLTINYNYATSYTANQLSQIAIRSSGLEVQFMKHNPNLYTEDIVEYISLSTPPTRNNIKLRQKYFMN